MVHLAIRSLCADSENRAEDISQRLAIPMCHQLRQVELDNLKVLIEVEANQIYLRLPSWASRARLSIDFSAGKLGFRQAKLGSNSELLKKAAGMQAGRQYSLLDATAGMGTDAVMLAALGFQVTALERQPLLAMMLGDALQRARAELDAAEYLNKLDFKNADALDWLSRDGAIDYDVVYLDPMFPERSKSAQVKKPMQLLQALLDEDHSDEASLLKAAMENAVYRVVVKRPARAPFLANLKPSHQIKGSNIRFDIYGLRSMRDVVQPD